MNQAKTISTRQLSIQALALMLAVILPLALTSCSGNKNVIGSVNGEPITREMYDANLIIPKLTSEEKGQVPEVITKQEVLDLVVFRMLLLQSAREKGVDYSEDAVNQGIASFLANLGTTQEEFEGKLTENGVSWSAFEENVHQTLVINSFMENYLWKNVIEDERQDFLEAFRTLRYQESTIEIDQDFQNEINGK
jgi:SurA-like N-terminal domain